MKQFLLLSTLIITIPFIIVFSLFNKEVEKNKKSDIYVRIKIEETDEIIKVKLEDYVIGVVAGEMPVSFHIEALKAQAVAGRTYALKRIEYNKNKKFDIVNGVLNQVYLDSNTLKEMWKENYNVNILKISDAVFTTKGEYIEYNNKIADTLFFSTSNGFTENSEEIFGFELPYLRSVQSIWDEKVSPVFKDNKSYSLSEFYNLIKIPYQDNLQINVIKKSSTGRILELKINGYKKLGSEIVDELKLRSNDFNIIKQDNNIIIKTIGYGHGVGMSQYGALGMAKEGYLYDEILKHYYQGTQIANYNF